MRKIDDQIAVNNVQNPEIQANRERAAKIERVAKPKSSELFAALTVSPLAAKNNTTIGVLDRKNSDDDMIRVPLIASNSSLPDIRA